MVGGVGFVCLGRVFFATFFAVTSTDLIINRRSLTDISRHDASMPSFFLLSQEEIST